MSAVGNFRISSESANVAADAVTKRVDGGYLRLYAASDQPGSPDTQVPGPAIMLVELAYGTPAFEPAKDGEAEAMPIASGRAVGKGRARWFRGFTKDRRPVYDGDVGLEKSGADLELGAVDIPVGAEVVVASARYRQPMSTRNGQR